MPVDLSVHADIERTIPAPVRRQVLARDNEQCQACGLKRGLHLHHWKSWRSAGGGHEPENLVVVCFRCHGLIHARQIDIVLVETAAHHWAAFVLGRYGRNGEQG